MVKLKNKKSKKSLFNKKVNPSKNSASQNRGQSLEQQAVSHLQNHRHKNAMDSFKRLLKQTPDNKQFQYSFLQAGEGRCQQLAEKKMFKEACVIWENLQRFIELNTLTNKDHTPHLGDYLQWLLISTEIHKALDIFLKQEAEIKKAPWFSTVQNHIAAHLLLAPQETLALMTEQYPMRRHCHDAKKALKAYCDQQFDVMLAILKNIPFRSAFKDFVLILKAQAAISAHSSTKDAGLLLNKVSQDSAFYPFSQTLLFLTLDNEILIQKLQKTKPQATLLLSEYLGWNKETLKTWNKIKHTLINQEKNHQEHKTKPLMQWLMNLKAFKNTPEKETIIKSVCILLLYKLPSELKSYKRCFGSLDAAETCRIDALISEKRNDNEDAMDEWHDFIFHTEEPLAKALVHRKIAQLAERMSDDSFYYDIEEEYTSEYNLQQSLKYDPQDKNSYLQLLDIYEKNNSQYKQHEQSTAKQKKARQSVINNALTHFPDDRNILLRAIKESQQRKAFKKAASLATRLLKIDPTNSFARQMLIDSHLSHARKHVISGKYHLLEKELKLASRIVADSPRVALFQGLLSFLRQESPETSRLLIDKAFKLFNNPLLGLLILNTELQHAKLNPKAAKHLFPAIDNKQKITSEQSITCINALFEQMQSYQNEGLNDFIKAFLKSDKLFKQYAKNIDSQEQRVNISRLLIHYKAYPLAKWFIKFDKKLLNKPIMQYYQVIADSQEQPEKVTDNQFERLEKALTEANESGDKQVSNLLLTLLNKIERSRLFIPTGLPGSVFNDYEDDDMSPFDIPNPKALFEMMEELLDNLPESERKNLMNDFEQDLLGGRKK